MKDILTYKHKMAFLHWIILLIVYQICQVLCQDQPEITEPILPDIKRLGTTGMLNCTVIYKGSNQVQWFQKNIKLLISGDEKILIPDEMNRVDIGWKYEVKMTVTGDKLVFSLLINRLERKDAGLYTCQVRQLGGEYIAVRDGDMVVICPPSVRQAKTANTVFVREGQAVNLTCEAEGYPQPNITWVRVSGARMNSGFLRHTGSLLTIHSAVASDRGMYRCLADNTVRPPATFDATLYVYFKPIARAVQSSYGQAENRQLDVTIECRVSGFPEPDLQWYKINEGGTLQPIDNDEYYTINILLNHANILDIQERWFQLVIRSVLANNYGMYVCEGANDYGIGRGQIELFPTSECQGPNCPDEGMPDTYNKGTSHVISTAMATVAIVTSALMTLL